MVKEFLEPGHVDVPLARARHPRRERRGGRHRLTRLNYLGATGTLLFLSGVLTTVVLKISPRRAVRGIYGETIRQFGWAIVTILCVFALAYVMNLSGQTLTLGRWLAGAGAFFAFLAPIVGWFGVRHHRHRRGRQRAVRQPARPGREGRVAWRPCSCARPTAPAA